MDEIWQETTENLTWIKCLLYNCSVVLPSRSLLLFSVSHIHIHTSKKKVEQMNYCSVPHWVICLCLKIVYDILNLTNKLCNGQTSCRKEDGICGHLLPPHATQHSMALPDSLQLAARMWKAFSTLLWSGGSWIPIDHWISMRWSTITLCKPNEMAYTVTRTSLTHLYVVALC